MNEKLKEKLAQATDALNQKHFSVAISLLGEATAEEPENAALWRQLGHSYLEAGKPDDALEALTRSLRLNPGDATAHCLLGNAYGSTCDLEKAAACYRRALEIEPQHVRAEELLIKTESLLESRAHYRAGLKLLYSASPTAPDLNQALRELLQSIVIFESSPARDNLLECARKLEALRSEWNVPVAMTPELDPWAEACRRGYESALLEKWSEAREAYHQAQSLRPGDAFVHHALGFASAEAGEIDAAVRAWLRTLELDRSYDFTQFGRV